MAGLFASGRLVDLVIAVAVIEAAVLLMYWRRGRHGIAPGDFLPNLCAGVLLLLALRVTLGGGGWMPTSGLLAAAGVAHLLDVRRRWRG